jgi:hypothetical protein
MFIGDAPFIPFDLYIWACCAGNPLLSILKCEMGKPNGTKRKGVEGYGGGLMKIHGLQKHIAKLP